MGEFEDFVNKNLGKRLPQLEDSGPPASSSVAAGILGTRYLDTDNNDLYEKTGHDNSLDWVKIGKLGDSRGGAGGSPDSPSFSVQFNESNAFGGSQNLIYKDEQLSGVSGIFQDEVIVGTGVDDALLVASGDMVQISGHLQVSGHMRVGGQALITGVKKVGNKLVFGRAGEGNIDIQL
ncbi:MAG: hypothetical protein CMM25_07850 [Rhodospirillaceae bacterium]|nr:hypothetical protein [Rhodospirillaceae bacterium]